ncbi:MAG: phosphoglyceromutase [Bacteroidetes bacterium]|nr:phosphoglyceromutase [Bacteroidota bacterium]
MKIIFFAVLLLTSICCKAQQDNAPNIFIITTDGFRWQEIFSGADSAILHDPHYVKDTALLKQLFWDDNADERRKLLLPFIWKTIAQQGSIYGNRDYDNSVTVANPYRFSYAGYNELFTGYADPKIIANNKRRNPNENVFQFLNGQPEYENKVAAFTSWNLFQYIFNKQPSCFYLNSGYEAAEYDSASNTAVLANGVQTIMDTTVHTRNDMLTFVTAKEYILTKHPKVVYIGFGETDEYAHSGRYDDYLQSAHLFDEYLAQLWYLVNRDPFYKNNTRFIITTDHGRGQKSSTWFRHDLFTKGSNNTWLMTLGVPFDNKGEVKTKGHIHNKELAQTIAGLAGFTFYSNHPVSPTTITTAVHPAMASAK